MKEPLVFNRGVVSPLSLARIDQDRVKLAAETMVNWIPRVLGPMSLRPGWQYLGATASNNAARYLRFIFSLSDMALLELTDSTMRIWVSDALITRPSVSSAVANGDFTVGVASWTNNDETGATSGWSAPGYLRMRGDGDAASKREQQITVAAGDQGVEHALTIVIQTGPVTLRVGTASGLDDYISEVVLETGAHSLAFTPTGNFFIEFSTRDARFSYVDSCNVESSGAVSITTPWTANDLANIRYDQSGDVLFIACKDVEPYTFVRRGSRSWSVERYAADDGPFMASNTDKSITITSDAITSAATLTASRSLFKSTHVGALFRITSEGQRGEKRVQAANRWSKPIRITGYGESRKFTVSIGAFTFTATTTVRLQRAIGQDGPWEDIDGATWTATVTTTYQDTLFENQEIWYRIGVKTGEFTAADDISPIIYTEQGTQTGVVRIKTYTSATSVTADIISELGHTQPTYLWAEGEWSDYRGYPTAVTLHDGRLWWAGKDKIFGSMSDDFWTFNPEDISDAGPLNRTIGKGPIDDIKWLMSLQRLIIGGEIKEYSVRASDDDGPITPTDFVRKAATGHGSGSVQALEMDHEGIFLHRNGERIMRISKDVNRDYEADDLTLLSPEFGNPGIVRMELQRMPDTRIHCVRSDGTVMLGVYDKAEGVLSWSDITTDGLIEDVVVLPGNQEDLVYYLVNRTINGATVRYLEKWALETECRGGTLNKQADSFVVIGPGAVITGLSHLEGEAVVVWGDGADVGTASDYTQIYTVSGGQITLSSAITTGILGLPYTAQWKSAKLGSGMKALMEKTRVSKLGLLMAWIHKKGLRFGPDFTNLDDLPEIEKGTSVSEVTTDYAEQPHVFPGVWRIDTRLCLQAQAPRPVTILAALPDVRDDRR